MFALKELSKEEEEPTELTEESLHTFPVTVTLNSTSLRNPEKSPELTRHQSDLPRSKPPSKDLPSEVSDSLK